jgi:phytanoyl-CoA hydroxylase
MNWQHSHPDSRQKFLDEGFVFLSSFLGEGEISEIRSNLARFVKEVLPTIPAEHVYYERPDDPTTLKQIQQLGQHDSYFSQWQNDSIFREVAELVLAGPVIPKNMQYFNKPPGLGKPTPPHQDGFYFMLDPCEAVTMWLALEEVDEENGCVRYVPRSHTQGMRKHGRTETLGFSQGIVDYPTPADSASEIAFPAQAGDLLAHHALTIHRADHNQSQTRSRQALGFIYYSERAQEDAAAHQAYQEELARQLKQSGKLAGNA